MDMSTREAIAPRKTTRRGWRMARMAEMKKVLSPISERMIVIKERMRVSAEKSVGDSVDIVYDVVGLVWERFV
jgi:hypothetical protein